MKRHVVFSVMAMSVGLLIPSVSNAGDVVVGQPAPAFAFTDTMGHAHTLAEFNGRFVVLEWMNPACPFVGKHYRSGNMPRLQTEMTKQQVVWLSIISSAPGKQGYSAPEQAHAFMREHGGSPTAIVLDEFGAIGRLYGARTTPHMFVIGPDGMLLYNGAIDDHPSTDPNDIPRATNYVRKALEEAMAGKPVSTPSVQPYGCSVKYE